MRIAVYKDSLSTGRGADRAVRNFAAGLAERGHDTVLFEKAALSARLAERWDVIVATGSNEIVDLDSADYFSRAGRAKVVLQLHLAPRGFFKWRHPLRNRRIRVAFDKADAVQVLCSSYSEEFGKIAPHPPVTVIGNYTEMQAGPVKGGDSKEGDARIILYPAAAVNKIKNQRLLIKAFALLANDFKGWNVRLLGKDATPYARRCRRLIDRLGLHGRVALVGFTDDLAGEYSRTAFVAFPSKLEGFPLAVLEAAKFALPVVAQSGLPGIEDIVTDGTGIVTAPCPAAYAEGLRRMMSDATALRKFGEAACIRCEELYARNKILDQWETFLESVVK